MKRNYDQAISKNYDLIIIGGGMFGACAVWEAAQRGLSAVLLEKGDFGGATSANHLKMVHGGIRYLQHGDIYRLRESVFERSAFLRIAPHLVQPLPVVMPTFGHGIKGKEILRIGMSVYDLLTLDRNLGIKDETRKIPACYSKTKDEVLSEFPEIEEKNLTGAAVFTDAQMYNPPRLALSFIKSAVENGADAFNYSEVTDIINDNDKIVGVKVNDLINDQQLEFKGKFVLNTSGPWSYNLLNKSLNIKIEPKPAFSRDAAFVINKQINPKHALAIPLKTKDEDALLDRGGRHVFIAPWLGKTKTLVGVWHIVWGESENKVYVKEEELKGFIKEVNEAYPAINVSTDDVSIINAGLTLFGETKPGSTRMSFGKRSRIIDHEKEHNIKGLISLIGVRATVARWDSKRVISQIAERLNAKIDESKTHKLPIWGGEVEDFERYVSDALKENINLDENVIRPLIHNYGSKYREVLNYQNGVEGQSETIAGTNKLKAEVLYAVKEEMAQKLSDVIFRKTDLGTDGDINSETLNICADIIGQELNWSGDKIKSEVNEVEKILANNGSVKDYNFPIK